MPLLRVRRVARQVHEEKMDPKFGRENLRDVIRRVAKKS